jgi:hypothetical protein
MQLPLRDQGGTWFVLGPIAVALALADLGAVTAFAPLRLVVLTIAVAGYAAILQHAAAGGRGLPPLSRRYLGFALRGLAFASYAFGPAVGYLAISDGRGGALWVGAAIAVATQLVTPMVVLATVRSDRTSTVVRPARWLAGIVGLRYRRFVAIYAASVIVGPYLMWATAQHLPLVAHPYASGLAIETVWNVFWLCQAVVVGSLVRGGHERSGASIAA